MLIMMYRSIGNHLDSAMIRRALKSPDVDVNPDQVAL
jgi:hypothetical protein